MATEAKRKGPGRPRVRPAGVIEQEVWYTQAELRRLRGEARTEGVTVPELIRRRSLGRES